MPITNGTIKYGRTVKTGDFENKRADVEFSMSFDPEDDVDARVKDTAALATFHLNRILGIKQAEAAKASVPEAPKRGPGRPPKAEPAPAPLGEADASGIPAGLKREPPKSEEPAKVEQADELAEFVEDDPASQPDVSDAELSSAMNRKVAELKPKHLGAAPKLIKELINKFVEPPKKSHDIPQNLRHKFLEDLAKLQ